MARFAGGGPGHRGRVAVLAVAGLALALGATPPLGPARADVPDPLPGVGHPTFLSPHVGPLARVGDHLLVANTPADTLDVIDTTPRQVVRRIPVGIQPVAVVARPDGREVWVANHVSDSVSVVDTDPASPPPSRTSIPRRSPPVSTSRRGSPSPTMPRPTSPSPPKTASPSSMSRRGRW